MKDHTQPRLQAPHTPNDLYCIDTLRNPDTLAPGQPTRPNLHPTGRVGMGLPRFGRDPSVKIWSR